MGLQMGLRLGAWLGQKACRSLTTSLQRAYKERQLIMNLLLLSANSLKGWLQILWLVANYLIAGYKIFVGEGEL